MKHSIHLDGFTKIVPSETDPDKTYEVVYGENLYAETSSRKGDKDWSCNCPQWEHRSRKSGNYCKHIIQTIKTGEFVAWEGETPQTVFDVGLVKSLVEMLNVSLDEWDEVDPDLIITFAREVWQTRKEVVPFPLIPVVDDEDDNTFEHLTLIDEGKTIIVMIDGKPDTIATGGKLPAPLWDMWKAYQKNKTDNNRNACITVGFDPDFDYSLKYQGKVENGECFECGNRLTKTSNGNKCTNPLCNTSVNNKVELSKVEVPAPEPNVEVPVMEKRAKSPKKAFNPFNPITKNRLT